MVASSSLFTATCTALSLLACANAACGTWNPRASAEDVISALALEPNVEGGFFVETFRDPAPAIPGGNRSVSTAIYYLLEGSNGPSVWHRVTDAAEVWHYYAGAPLTLFTSANNGSGVAEQLLGPDILAVGGTAQRPQLVIPAGKWQRARSEGDWTLVGTTVAPAFVPEAFELAEPGWEPS